MARDSSLEVRETVIIALKGGATGRAVEERVHLVPPPSPTFPYVRYGVALPRPFQSTGIDGMVTEITIHVFADGDTDDACQKICAAVVRDLGDKTLKLVADYEGQIADLRWTGGEVLRDIGRARGWHGTVRLLGTVVT